MKRAAIAFSAAAAFVLGVACTSGDSLSDGEYFQKILDAKQESDRRESEVVVPALDPAASRDEIERIWEDALNTQVTIAEDRHGALDELDAPGDLSRLHGLYVEAANESVAALKEYREQQIVLLKDGKYGDVPAAAARVDNAAQSLTDLCTDLQDAAGEREIDIDLACS